MKSREKKGRESRSRETDADEKIAATSTYQVHIIDFRKILNPLCYVLVDKLGKPYNEIQSHLSHHVETTALCPKS